MKPRLTRPAVAGPLVIREGAHVTNFDVMPKEDPHDIKGKGKAEDEPIPKKRNRPTTNQGGCGEPEDARGQTATNMVIDTVNEGADVEGSVAKMHNNPLFSEKIVMAEAENQPRQEP